MEEAAGNHIIAKELGILPFTSRVEYTERILRSTCFHTMAAV
jgi:hypothetical protein